jgi:hypothetical protein
VRHALRAAGGDTIPTARLGVTPMTDETAVLKAQLAAVRFQLRALWLVVLAVAALGIFPRLRTPGANLGGEGRPAIQLEAQQFQVLDPEGCLRGQLRAPPAGPSLELFDEAGRVRAALWQRDGAVGLRLTDADGRVVFEQPK